MHSLLELFRDFARRKHFAGSAFIVGGAVRDILLGKDLKDADIALKGDALGTAREFAAAVSGSFVLLDSGFEIARVVKGDERLDLSALRGDSILADLAARDITINAMAIPLKDREELSVMSDELKDKDTSRATQHPSRPSNTSRITHHASLPLEIIDPFHGRDDLAQGIIRMVSEENLRQDPLRLLRIYRFAAALSFSVEKDTLDAVGKLAPLVNTVASERITEELRQILKLDHSYRTIQDMTDNGLMPALFPAIERPAWDGALRLYRKAEEVLNSIALSFPAHAEPILQYFRGEYRKICLKLSVLFPTPESAKDTALKLKMSGKEVEFLSLLASHRADIAGLYKSFDKKAAILLLKRLRDDIHAVMVLGIAHAGLLFEEKKILAFCRDLMSLYHEEIRPRMELPPLITGDDLIHEFHLNPSPLFKKILGAIEDMTLLGEIATREDALRAARKMLE